MSSTLRDPAPDEGDPKVAGDHRRPGRRKGDFPAVPVQKPPDRVTSRRCELLDHVPRHADIKE
jgi:hypothetical protein